ncbi:ComE operon protein 1 [Actinomyces bovis]|uniref:ComE operon protein 1 n=1 Tax=Actinomyces bovis TaxID=1658 RepID=A0ABY1VKA6_9ACTO|nr:ComEA family DNA-binding protein [Actinomyces bovis]SPT52533.1 ComE operon protein 1 [Actinomyces bovis]VEG54280.1 ComE operon protein 1 [Actinomyces israelii]
MTGRRVKGRERRLEELVRRAYTTEPLPTVHHPRRLALAPRAAMAAGCALITLAIVLAVAAVLRSPTPSPLTLSPPGATSTLKTGASGPSATKSAAEPANPTLPAPSGPKAGEVTVHVTGAVSSPGVIRLPTGARVADAVEAAGGATTEADTQALNLARVLTDGEQVRVPKPGESPPPGAAGNGTGDGGSSGGTSSNGDGGAGSGRRVNVNTADATALEALPGIGPTLAKRIVAYRKEHGPFAAVDDLTDVPGIGPAVLEGLRQEATV